MNTDRSRIPDVHLEKIGGQKNAQPVIKGWVALPCWNGYYLYDDSYKLVKEKVVTNGRIPLWVDGLATETNDLIFSEEQTKAYWYLVDRQDTIQQAMLEALQTAFPRLLAEEYSSWDQDDEAFPKLTETNLQNRFRDFIGPESISIGEDVKDGMAYLTWRFRCRWDIEHGLDFITHQERVIDIAPEADPWKISKDNGTYEQEWEAYHNRPVPERRKKKNWWQFW